MNAEPEQHSHAMQVPPAPSGGGQIGASQKCLAHGVRPEHALVPPINNFREHLQGPWKCNGRGPAAGVPGRCFVGGNGPYLIWICLAFAASVFGMVSFSTPSAYSASMPSASTYCGRRMRRSK